MKKIILTVIAGLAMTFSQAQDITDAVRYSTEELSGTARFRAMSGAFGALGGDLSAIGVNPAGSAVYLNSSSTVTLSYNKRENNTRYFNGLTSNNSTQVDFDQAGAVLVFNSMDPENNWNKFTLGINYSKTNNFDNNFLARGQSSTSIDQYFLGYANGVPLDLLETVDNETVGELYRYLGENEGFGAQQALLGYQGFIINPESNDLDNTTYFSSIGQGPFSQEYAHAATGLNGKFTFNLATEFSNFLYLGANLNAHFLNFDRTTRLIENNSNTGSETNQIIFSNNLSTAGTGFSAQVGGIAKLSEGFRIGVAYDTPTWYTISEQMNQRLETNNSLNERIVVNPNVLNIYPDYTIKTPGKLTGSAAILLGKVGLISFDYSYRDWTDTELRPVNDPEFMVQNEEIDNSLRAASTYRIGGEFRINALSLRGGYRIEESPYLNETTIGELTGYTVGLGFNFGNAKLDLAYDNANRVNNPQLYQVGLTNAATVDRDLSSVILSLSFGI